MCEIQGLWESKLKALPSYVTFHIFSSLEVCDFVIVICDCDFDFFFSHIVSYLCKITDLITLWHFVLNNVKGPVALQNKTSRCLL